MSPSSYDHRSGLLQLAREGNASAIEDLFACYQHYLRLLAHSGLSSKVKTRVTVSDVIQETFLHAFEAFEQFRGASTGEFVAWIRSILVSRIADAHEKHLHAARRDVRREVSIDTIQANLSRSSMGLETIARDHLQKSPGSIVSQQEHAILVADAIGELPVDYQQVIVMRHFDGLSFEDIAERMDRSSGAIRMVWLRAIQKMKQVLKETQS
ncbi:sigma-70 family RNA polymerase sigma factor [Rubripirellula amarantea]|uniref:ECF RNA polymerase sigma-E factor n=1 Tax=Rubripirellula amarantea TaxID=2527999 RepID=A0A5C5WXP3_9BACT|nr:sigma-70 family RNA polymerase sigma factor [Rubripirellula amarantea]MDA8745833.1 sigma-70 family RNA polymerase sigma factor [Rubripirellula amarantea]TWT54773.1 ECF RNA polymerase sigma-E factor [Rubripirellula amarantea]